MYKKLLFPPGLFPMTEQHLTMPQIAIPFITHAKLVNLDNITVSAIKAGNETETIDKDIVSTDMKKWQIGIAPLTINVMNRLLKEKGSAVTVPTHIHMLNGNQFIDIDESANLPELIAMLQTIAYAGLLILDRPQGVNFSKAINKLMSSARNNQGEWNIPLLEHMICSHEMLLQMNGCTIEDMIPEFSFHDTDDLTGFEQDIINMIRACPDCGGLMEAGPKGGMSQNCYCSDCKAGFNLCPPLLYERITNRMVATPDGVLNCIAQ